MLESCNTASVLFYTLHFQISFTGGSCCHQHTIPAEYQVIPQTNLTHEVLFFWLEVRSEFCYL